MKGGYAHMNMNTTKTVSLLKKLDTKMGKKLLTGGNLFIRKEILTL